jgi:CheY-like chemotaxis protein
LAEIPVVDDDPLMQVSVRHVLEQAGHAVAMADGTKGFGGLGPKPSACVLLNVFMPEMDGFETMRRIPKRHPDLPIIMTSGWHGTPDLVAEPDDLARALKLCAVPALPKPFKPAQLLIMVADCLASANPPTSESRPDRNALPNT